MPWYRHIAAFLHHNLPLIRTNLAPLTAAILNRRALSLSELARPYYARNAPKPPPAGAKTLLSLPL